MTRAIHSRRPAFGTGAPGTVEVYAVNDMADSVSTLGLRHKHLAALGVWGFVTLVHLRAEEGARGAAATLDGAENPGGTPRCTSTEVAA
ncbi:hypothetical protein GCM10010341_08320 [Streptomyces noursei]|nr:hypothetical protein GCM10010341_08320 [Streptomyces noursei]